MHIGTEGSLITDSSTVFSIDGEDSAPMGGGSAEPAAPAAPEAPASPDMEAAPSDDGSEAAEAATAEPVVEDQQFDPAIMADVQRLLGGMPQPQQAAQAAAGALLARAGDGGRGKCSGCRSK